MSDAATRTDDLTAPPAPGLEESVDDALAGLAAPPRARLRVVGALLCAVSAASLFLAWQLRDDVRYALAPTAPLELGDAQRIDLDGIRPNQLVHVRASPEMAGAVRYRRPLLPGDFVVFPVAGRIGEPLYVQVDGDASSVAPGEFTGRLIPFSGAGGRYGRVGSYLQHELGAPVSAGTLLIVDGASPRASLWAIGLAAFLVALAISDLLFLLRLVRPAER